MSLTLLIPDARRLVVQNTGVTAYVPATKIGFSQRAQGQQLPGIVINMGTVDYEATMTNATASTIYRVDYLVYSDTAEQTAFIHEAVKAAALAYNSANFTIRLFDESYFVDVDLIHRSTLSCTFEYSV